MALLICSECEGKVSSLAASCPHCGAPVPKTSAASSGVASVSQSSTQPINPLPRQVPPAPSRAAPDLNKPMATSRQPSPLNIAARDYQDQNRPVSVPLLLGIFFLPFIFAWFLLQKGYSQVSRVAGFAWMVFVLFVMVGLLRLMSDLFWTAPANPNLDANGAVTTTQPQDPNQTPINQQPLRPLVAPSQVQNNPITPPIQTNVSPQPQPTPDPIQFNQAPPSSIDNAANTAANPTPSDNSVNPFNDTRPIHSNDNSTPSQ